MDELRISPKELKNKIDGNEDIFLLDVRTPEEEKTAKINCSVLVPLAELKFNLEILPRDKEIIIYCHHGKRSFEAAKILSEHNFNAKSLTGGIDCWSRFIDSKVPQY